jgi:hypothetical protein
MPTMEAQTYLPEYRVTLGAELFVTAKSPFEALGIAMKEVNDVIVSEAIHATEDYSIGNSLDILFTTVTVEKMGEDDDEDDEDGDDDAPDDMPRKPKKPAKMRK